MNRFGAWDMDTTESIPAVVEAKIIIFRDSDEFRAAADKLWEHYGQEDMGCTRAQVEHALWEWLQYCNERLLKDACDYVLGPYPQTFQAQFFSNALRDAWRDSPDALMAGVRDTRVGRELRRALEVAP